jgi:hypothetical protein
MQTTKHHNISEDIQNIFMNLLDLMSKPGRKMSEMDPDQCFQGVPPHQLEQPDQHELELQPKK